MTFFLAGCGQPADRNLQEDTAYTQAVKLAEYKDAIQKYRNYYDAEPGNLTALLGLARNLRYAGLQDQALEELQAARQKFEDHPALLTEIGKVYLTAGEIGEAKTYLQNAQARGGNWQTFTALGIVYDFKTRYGDALKSYAMALEECPDSASILNNMGISAAMTGDLLSARNFLTRASAMRPDSARIRNNLKLLRKLRLECPDCSADYYRMKMKRAIVPQDWAYEDLACGPGYGDIVYKLSQGDPVDVRVHFEFDKAELLPEATQTLDNMARAFSSEELKELRFELEGHTDAVGTESYNQGLSERRARAVKNYLVNVLGIEEERLYATGYGESQLLDPDNPKSGINRRVRIIPIQVH